LAAPALAAAGALLTKADRLARHQLARGFSPRALAAFVKRPQAALLKSALRLFYKALLYLGQKNVLTYFSGTIRTTF
jgi:hypothetical protein